jgi:hypothetical protein
VAAIPAMRPCAAKEDDMPDYRPDAPSVDLFTAHEHLILCDWFGVDPRGSERVGDILDEWSIPEEIYGYSRPSAAVAQILLERVQDRLPQWVGPKAGARPLLDRRSHRKVELWPRHLLTINWADSGPGFSWPVAYNATYVPGFDRSIVTASADCLDMFGGVCDVAIGSFGREVPIIRGCHDIIISDWSWQRGEWDQQRWAYLFDAGLVSKAEAQAWANEVWGDHSNESDEDSDPRLTLAEPCCPGPLAMDD